MLWLIVLVVAVVLGALAWWSSRRKRKGVDPARVQQLHRTNASRGTDAGGGITGGHGSVG